MILEALPHSSGASLSFSIFSSSGTPGWALVPCPSCPPLPPRTGCGCQEVKESVGSGWGVASGLDFLQPDRFTTVSWAQDRTAVSYKCPCQSPGWEALLRVEAPGPTAPTPLGASPGEGPSSRRPSPGVQPSRPLGSLDPSLRCLMRQGLIPPPPAHSSPLQVQILWFQLPQELSEGRGHPRSPPT